MSPLFFKNRIPRRNLWRETIREKMKMIKNYQKRAVCTGLPDYNEGVAFKKYEKGSLCLSWESTKERPTHVGSTGAGRPQSPRRPPEGRAPRRTGFTEGGQGHHRAREGPQKGGPRAGQASGKGAGTPQGPRRPPEGRAPRRTGFREGGREAVEQKHSSKLRKPVLYRLTPSPNSLKRTPNHYGEG